MNNLRRFLLLAITTLVLSCAHDQDLHTIQYYIDGTGTMIVTYADENGVNKTVSDATSAWSYDFQAPGDGRILRLAVTSTDGSPVTGAIYIDAKEAARETSAGGVIALSVELN